MKHLNHRLTIVGVAILLALIIFLPLNGPLSWLQFLAGWGLMAVLPGYALLYRLWLQPAAVLPNAIERGLLAIGLSYGLSITLFLIIALSGLPLNTVFVVGGLLALIVVAVFSGAAPEEPSTKPAHQIGLSTRSYSFGLLSILLIALFFRVASLYYSNYQGDEAEIVLRAVALINGDLDAILTHSKGPGEVLVLNGIGAMTAQFDELTARLPFALAGIVSVGLVVMVGRLLFRPAVGLIA
ncbi:MAG: hypothetical protein R3264_19720 [Anaerolineae bacterium]|nr:hypothetical protein [Anaerolineae bacterium]